MKHKQFRVFGFFLCMLAGASAFFAFTADRLPAERITYREAEEQRGDPLDINNFITGKNEDRGVFDSEYKKAFTTVFWIGEGATEDSGFIANHQSAWDSFWQEHYGGVDSPYERCGYKPCGFEPEENPFYFALPYNDLGEGGVRKASAFLISWFQEKSHQKSVVKNSWIEVVYGRKTCYAQWEDVGPHEMDDFDYVFGNEPPKAKAGLDVSPAVRDCLGMKTNGSVFWKFVSYEEVPPGPWKEIITVRDVSW